MTAESAPSEPKGINGSDVFVMISSDGDHICFVSDTTGRIVIQGKKESFRFTKEQFNHLIDWLKSWNYL